MAGYRFRAVLDVIYRSLCDQFSAVHSRARTDVHDVISLVHGLLYLEVAPRVFTTLRQQLTELSTNNPEILKKGAVGKINNAFVCIENCLAEADGAYMNILRTDKAVAFAEQIEKVEHYRPEDAFTSAVKGLYVFGAKVVRPDEIYVMKTKK